MVLSVRLNTRAGLLAISAGAVLWGTSGVVMHAVHDRSGLSAAAVGFYRLFTAALVLVAVRGRDAVRLARRSGPRRRWALVAAGVGLGAYQALYFVSVEDVGVSLSTLISIGVAPVVLTAGAALARRRWPSRSSVTTLVAAIAGLALICLPSGTAGAGPRPVLGVVAAVACGLVYAGATAVNQRLAVADPLTLTGATSAVGAVALLPVVLPGGITFAATPSTIGALLYLGVVTTAAGYGLFFTGLRSTPAEVAAVLTLLEPLAATVLAIALLGERLTAAGAVGSALLLAAVAWLYLRPGQSASAAGSSRGVPATCARAASGDSFDRSASR
ncbi:MAG TPA: EamA family transporter [Jatrophihabitantaceae bacterium]|jgi:DME family drug/metabolite transporter